jgi:hypothetical protein
MEFLALVTTLDAISRTSKRRKKISLVAKLLREVEVHEIDSAALFLAGTIFPENEERVLNVSWNGLILSNRHYSMNPSPLNPSVTDSLRLPWLEERVRQRKNSY